MTATPMPAWALLMVEQAQAGAEDITAALALSAEYGQQLPMPASGQTALRWQILAAVAACDLTVARVLEAHTDALAILHEAGHSDLDEPSATANTAGVAAAGTWGVFAAEGAGTGLDASADGAGWSLTGTKPWCSLGGVLDHALVTARVETSAKAGLRRLFAVDLQSPAVTAHPPSAWASRGLREVISAPVHFDHAPGRPVGAADWYLNRPGFAWGGIGVAACWLGGAQALGETLRRAVTKRGGEIAQMHLGAVDVALHGASAVLGAASAQVDAGQAEGQAGALLALRVRAVVAAAAEETMNRVAHALGPAPLAFDAEHARRVADLAIYVRQHHAERDLSSLGAMVADHSESS